MPASPDIAAEVRRLLAAEGPMPVARFMALANAHYYASKDPFGPAGDFVTAPEISQMFGELIGLTLADAWQRARSPRKIAYVELGPGRGTLAADALRAMKVANCKPQVHFVETSPLLRDAQRERVADAQWHDTVDTLPADRPLLIACNEFFDALPVRQFVRTVTGWRERMVRIGIDGFEPAPGEAPMEAEIAPHLRRAEPGAIVEHAPAAEAVMAALAARLAAQGGAMLAIDYGHDGRAAGDTLQAVHAHAYADPFARPGISDLTAHVDFAALARVAEEGGADVVGPVDQGQWLVTLDLAGRAAALSRTAPERQAEIADAYRRLTSPDEMGSLFKVLGLSGGGWPDPAGF